MALPLWIVFGSQISTAHGPSLYLEAGKTILCEAAKAHRLMNEQ